MQGPESEMCAGRGCLFPVAEGSGLCCCWGDQQKGGVVGHEKGKAMRAGTGREGSARVWVAIPTWVCVHD